MADREPAGVSTISESSMSPGEAIVAGAESKLGTESDSSTEL